jgi:hypothetical protein
MLAQELIFEKPDNLKDLPSSETYKIMQDKSGYIWFCTEAGVCRYNGRELKTFRAKEGIPEGACYAIKEDRKGTIWVITSKNRILKYSNGSFVEIPVSRQFSKRLNQVQLLVNSLNFVGDTSMLISTRAYTYEVHLSEDRMKEFGSDLKDIDCEIRSYHGYDLALHPISTFGYGKPYIAVKSTKKFDIALNTGTTKKLYTITKTELQNIRHRILTLRNNAGDLLITGGDFLVVLKKDLTESTINVGADILCMCMDKNNGLWLGLRSVGLLYYPNASDVHKQPLKALEGVSVSDIVEDTEGNIWCTTVENGVFCCRNKKMNLIYENSLEKNKRPFLVKCVNDSIFLFKNNGDLIRFIENKADSIGTSPRKLYISDVLFIENKWMIAGKQEMLRYSYNLSTNTGLGYFGSNTVSGSLVQLIKLKNGKLFGCHYTCFCEIVNDRFHAFILKMDSNIRGMVVDSSDAIFIYSHDIIYKLEDTYSKRDDLRFKLTKTASFKNMIKVIIDSKDRFWIITKNAGLYKYEKGKTENLSHLGLNFGSAELDFNDIYEDKMANIWVATNIGLLKLRQQNNTWIPQWFTKEFGLPEGEFFKITGTGKELVACTKTAVCKFPLTSTPFSHKFRVPVYLSSVKVNDSEIQQIPKESLSLDYNENTIQVKYDILDYNSAENSVRLAYKVLGYDEVIHYLDNPEILLTKLPPGNFQLQVSVVDENNKTLSDINTLQISIEYPFWQKWPFVIFMILMGISLIVLIVALISKRIKKKAEEKTRIDKLLTEYQMSALKAQMNPHFIFNCINSIQRYILTNKTNDAYDYLAKFSKLIRLVLNYSDDALITLEEELEIANLYIQMEQMRYEGFFTYEIVYDEEIRTNSVYLPSLLLQPYIENAIWHGIMNLKKTRDGRLRVEIVMKDSNLRISIEDNGVGRTEAGKSRNQNHKSKALGLNKKRVELLNLMNDSVSASVEIEDVTDEENTIKGTIVKITIPQIYKHE